MGLSICLWFRYLDELVDTDEEMDLQLNDFVSASISDPYDFEDGQLASAPLNQRDPNSDEEFIIRDDQVGMIEDRRELTPWDPTFDPKDIFDSNFMSYLTEFFHKNCDVKSDDKKKSNESKEIKKGSKNDKIDLKSLGLLSFEKFSSWNDIKQMLKEGQVDSGCLFDLWVEAVMEYQWKYETPGLSLNYLCSFI